MPPAGPSGKCRPASWSRGRPPRSVRDGNCWRKPGPGRNGIEYLTTIYTTPGFTDERIHLFLATGITAGEPRPMSDEFLVVEAKPLSRVLEMIRDRELVHRKSISSLLYLAGFR